ncbi:MAG TPA: alpha/beta fold hydrolase [Prolixibacteraceae bacterium]|jgi:hypothetical protein
MKLIAFIIALNVVASGLFAQGKMDASESELVLKTATGNIYGTLTVAPNVKTSPVVLIIAGSGPTDRNCNSPAGIQTNAYKMLSEGFATNNISSLRFDKRGIGESKPAMTSESELRFETYINDVVAWINLLKADNRFSKVIILGHSEGSLLGMIAAEKTKVGAYISIAGAGRSADLILQEQLKTKLPPQLMMESNKILESLKKGELVPNTNPSLATMYRPSVQPYMISWIKYDPAQEIKKLKVPVLIIQGTTDLQVPVEDAKLLSAAKPDAKLMIIDNMNHVMKESDANASNNMATYKNPTLPLKNGLMDGLVNFIMTKK